MFISLEKLAESVLMDLACFYDVLLSCQVKLGTVRTRLTKYVWLYQKSRQILAPPNFQFGNRVRT